MSQNKKKQFGVWMDTHQATIVGRLEENAQNFTVVGYAGDAAIENAPKEQEHYDAKTSHHKFYKEILSHMINAEEVHITGTGTAQEQLMHFMAGIPQFKKTITSECTSNKMSEERLVEFIAEKFNNLN